MRDLGVLPGTSYSVAYDINTQGDIVGSAQPVLGSPAKRAFLWRNGQLTDLNTLLPPHSGWTWPKPAPSTTKARSPGKACSRPRPRLPADPALGNAMRRLFAFFYHSISSFPLPPRLLRFVTR